MTTSLGLGLMSSGLVNNTDQYAVDPTRGQLWDASNFRFLNALCSAACTKISVMAQSELGQVTL